MPEEIWKDIIGYEGIYQVSNFGNVKSIRKTKEKLLKPFDNGLGYLCVVLCTNNKPKTRTVHSLVIEAFIGPRPEGMDVCHNDGSRHNNHLDNLRYDTHLNNMIDCVKQNRPHFQKLRESDVKEIRKLLNKKELTQVQIAKMYNIKQATVSYIKTHNSWGWLDED